MSNDYFFPSYFKRISVSTHIVAPVPLRKVQSPICLETDCLVRLRYRSSLVPLGFNPHFATGLSEQDSSADDMDLSSHALKPDWWEGGFQERFCDRTLNFYPSS